MLVIGAPGDESTCFLFSSVSASSPASLRTQISPTVSWCGSPVWWYRKQHHHDVIKWKHVPRYLPSVRQFRQCLCSNASLTPGYPYVHLGKYNSSLWYLRGKCPLWLILPMCMYWRSFLVELDIFKFEFMFVKSRDMHPLFCLNVHTDIVFLQHVPCGDRICCYEISYLFARGFTNIKSNRNLSKSDQKFSPVHICV